MTPELAPPILTTTPHQREDVSALDRFNMHRCPTWRVFCGTRLELVTKPATIRYLYYSTTAATFIHSKSWCPNLIRWWELEEVCFQHSRLQNQQHTCFASGMRGKIHRSLLKDYGVPSGHSAQPPHITLTKYCRHSFEHQTGSSAFWLGSSPVLRWSGAFHLSSANFTTGLVTQWLFRVPPCRKATIHKKTYMPPPGFEPRPNGTTVNITNYYTG
ncbi:uncharacterized protein TNCV_3252281 [Trichonephila clavipes]|nr:uncharacterized protein TNCV_3252281 [Trichonephila clavipes]